MSLILMSSFFLKKSVTKVGKKNNLNDVITLKSAAAG